MIVSDPHAKFAYVRCEMLAVWRDWLATAPEQAEAEMEAMITEAALHRLLRYAQLDGREVAP